MVVDKPVLVTARSEVSITTEKAWVSSMVLSARMSTVKVTLEVAAENVKGLVSGV